MTTLCAYHNGPRGDVILCRPVFRHIKAHLDELGARQLVIATCRDDAPWFADLVDRRCRLVASDLPNSPFGAPVDLAYLAPAGATLLPIWLGGTGDRPTRQWPDVLDHLGWQLEACGLRPVSAEPDLVPMVNLSDLPTSADEAVPALRPGRPTVYLDNERSLGSDGYFVHDTRRLVDVLPHHDLLHTGPVVTAHPNLIDIRATSPPARARLSEQCVAIVSTSPERFAVTLTDANRFKPKALCGYDARVEGPPWDYPGNPLEMLATMDELVDFLLANAFDRREVTA